MWLSLLFGDLPGGGNKLGINAALRELSPFEYHGGLHLRDTILWLDAPEARPLSFISHAAVPGAQEHQKIVSTAETADLLRALAATHGKGRKVREPQALITPTGRSFTIGNLSLELFPSGHFLGSASLLLRHEGQELVYAGDINPRLGYLAADLEARHCDLLVLPARYPRRSFVLPPQDEARDALVKFVTDALAEGAPVVVFCPPLGEAQEVAHLLLEAGLPVRAHRRIDTACRAYTTAGIDLSGVKQLSRSAQPPPEALLWPLTLRNSPTLRRYHHARTALVGSEALDPEARALCNCEASFALSCLADYGGLMEYVKACNPGQVVLLANAATELEEDLRGLGISVSTLGPSMQMDLF